jgi:hypothetical protein
MQNFHPSNFGVGAKSNARSNAPVLSGVDAVDDPQLQASRRVKYVGVEGTLMSASGLEADIAHPEIDVRFTPVVSTDRRNTLS